MNCHYVPRFLLKQFTESEKLYLYDLDSKKTLRKDISKSFSIEDYYPEWLEKKLNQKIEVPFNNLLQNKLLKETSFTLNKTERELIGKFFLIQTLRINFEQNVALKDPTFMAQAFIVNSIGGRSAYDQILKEYPISKDLLEEHFNDIRNVLKYDLETLTKDDDFGIVSYYAAMMWIGISSLNVISSERTKHSLVLADSGYVTERDMSHIKARYIESQYNIPDRDFVIFSNISFPDNFMYYPISSTRAIVMIDPFFALEQYDCKSRAYTPVWKTLNITHVSDDSLYYFQYMDEFGITHIELQYITTETVQRLNNYTLNEITHTLGFVPDKTILDTLTHYQAVPRDERLNDYTDLVKYIEKKLS